MRSRRRTPRLLTRTVAAPEKSPRLSAEQRGNVTEAHRGLLQRLTPDRDAPWSTRALWACLEELRESVITEAAEVRVFDAWTDGDTAFCVVYSPPYQAGERVGLRRHRDDPEVPDSYGLGSQLFLEHGSTPTEDGGPADPIAFGVSVAAFDVGEPLGNYFNTLRRDSDGVGWWGSLDGDAPPLRR